MSSIIGPKASWEAQLNQPQLENPMKLRRIEHLHHLEITDNLLMLYEESNSEVSLAVKDVAISDLPPLCYCRRLCGTTEPDDVMPFPKFLRDFVANPASHTYEIVSSLPKEFGVCTQTMASSDFKFRNLEEKKTKPLSCKNSYTIPKLGTVTQAEMNDQDPTLTRFEPFLFNTSSTVWDCMMSQDYSDEKHLPKRSNGHIQDNTTANDTNAIGCNCSDEEEITLLTGFGDSVTVMMDENRNGVFFLQCKAQLSKAQLWMFIDRSLVPDEPPYKPVRDHCYSLHSNKNSHVTVKGDSTKKVKVDPTPPTIEYASGVDNEQLPSALAVISTSSTKKARSPSQKQLPCRRKSKQSKLYVSQPPIKDKNKREQHNKAERQRREGERQLFQMLRNIGSQIEILNKAPKGTVLDFYADYIELVRQSDVDKKLLPSVLEANSTNISSRKRIRSPSQKHGAYHNTIKQKTKEGDRSLFQLNDTVPNIWKRQKACVWSPLDSMCKTSLNEHSPGVNSCCTGYPFTDHTLNIE